MKTRVIPAQVTTVEDKIAGNLNFTQILLLVASVLVSSGIFIVLPKPFAFELYKLVIIILIFGIFGTMAIRIHERIVLSWMVLFVSYALRPHIYVFDKNTTFGRPVFRAHKEANINKKTNPLKIAEEISPKFGLDYFSAARSTNFNIQITQKGAKAVKSI